MAAARYCSDNCQKNHEKICKKRLDEIRDDDLFTQPDISHKGECPICCLPLSIDKNKSSFMSCCSKTICLGCEYANRVREMKGGLEEGCAFCREPVPKSLKEFDKCNMNRTKKNDPAAMVRMGVKCKEEGDYEGVLEYLTKAAKLGDADAHYMLSLCYMGEVVEKDMQKQIYHLEEAAIAGHPTARFNLGVYEAHNGRFERASKHYIIAAKLGDDDALEMVKKYFGHGLASKEDYADALRAHQAAVDATKSPEREKAQEALMTEADQSDGVCSNCGIAGFDNMKLEECDVCKLVLCGSEWCQQEHDEDCRKRADELRDQELVTLPDGSHLGECPICCLPLPIEARNVFMGCCCKLICFGCDYANQMREFEAGLEPKCAFCREPAPETQEESDERIMERVKKNCPDAMCQMGKKRYHEGGYETPLKYFTKAAELGDVAAHYELSVMYREGRGVEKDMKRFIYYSEEAAIGGHPSARYNLGIFEADSGRFEKAVKHFIIAANLGHGGSLECLRKLYAGGEASKEEYADALRAYQAAVDATKSVEREKAKEAMKNGEMIYPSF